MEAGILSVVGQHQTQKIPCFKISISTAETQENDKKPLGNIAISTALWC